MKSVQIPWRRAESSVPTVACPSVSSDRQDPPRLEGEIRHTRALDLSMPEEHRSSTDA